MRRLVGALVLALVAVSSVPARAEVPAWTSTVAPAPASYATGNGDDIACATRRFCVEVGTAAALRSGTVNRLRVPVAAIITPNSTRTRVLPLPIDADRSESVTLQSVACTSATSCVAVGGYRSYDGRSRPLIETYQDGHWSASSVPGATHTTNGLSLHEISCNARSCLAIGSYYYAITDFPFVAVRDSHGVWSHAPISNAGTFFAGYGPACAPGGGCYLSGLEYPGDGSSLQRAVFVYPDGDSYRDTYYPMPAGADIHTFVVGGMSCPAVDFCTALARYQDEASGEWRLAIERLIDGELSVRELPIPQRLRQDGQLSVGTTSCGSPAAGTPCVAVASYQGEHTMLATFSDGRWSVRAAPVLPGLQQSSVALSDTACTSAGSCVAVGQAGRGARRVPVVERWSERAGWQAVAVTQPDGAQVIGLFAASCGTDGGCAATATLPGFVTAADPFHLAYARSS